MSELRDIFDIFMCDKSDHHYHEVYARDLSHIRDKPFRMLEIGIWKGASTESFLRYFPKVKISGVDIFTRLDPDDVPVLFDLRVTWTKGDSTQDDLPDDWRNFDVIIDDGKHTPIANAETFKRAISRLSDHGIYYIEDVWPLDILTAYEWSHHWIKARRDEYNMQNWGVFMDAIAGYHVERIDLRKKSGRPDSYIFKITKPHPPGPKGALLT